MPQDGSGNYQYPPGTPGVPDQTIESEAYNTFIDDLITNDLNIARPIHRGGTGATTANQALVNLTAEKALQIVTNYDSHVWMSGSFYADATATGAPTAISACSGICVVSNTDYITVEARNLTSGEEYVRQKIAGSWGPWKSQIGNVVDLDARYVNLTGDTMTGALNVIDELGVHSATHAFVRSNSTVGSFSVFGGQKAGKNRWEIYAGNNEAETGGNAGSNFTIARVDDAGTGILGFPLSINRATGRATFANPLSVAAMGSTFGTAGALPPGTPPATTDANILFYNFGENWAGVGVNNGGEMWFRTGLSGTPLPGMVLDTTGALNLTGAPARTNLFWGATGIISSLSNDSNGTPSLNFWAKAGTGLTFTTGAFPGLILQADGVGGLIFKNMGANSINVAPATILHLQSTGQLTLIANPTAVFSATTKQYVDTSKLNPGVMKVGVLTDSASGIGFNNGVSSITDGGVGYVDIAYSTAFINAAFAPVVATLGIADINLYHNCGLPGAAAARIHSINQATQALQDPTNYFLFAGGTQ